MWCEFGHVTLEISSRQHCVEEVRVTCAGTSSEGDGFGFGCRVWGFRGSSRWTTNLSTKVNLPHAIELRASCGANLVTYLADDRGNKPRVRHRVEESGVTSAGTSSEGDGLGFGLTGVPHL